MHRILIILFHVILLTKSTDQQPTINSLIARFQSNGIRGYVLFSENSTSTSISTKIFNSGFNNETYSWKIYNSGYMIDNNNCNVRNSIYLSFDLTLLMGRLEPVKQNIFNVKLNFVTGEHSFLGKTLVLKGDQSGDMSCAIVLPFENKMIFVSNFRTEVQGLVYFLQSGNLFSIISSLYHASPLTKTSMHDWAVIRSKPTQTRSKNSQFDNELTSCQNLDANQLLKNNETDQISISSERSTLNSRSYINLQHVLIPETAKLFFVLLNRNSQIVACAPIVQISTKKVVAKFSEDHLTGQVMFSQESPIDPTLVDIELKVNQYSYSYGIDELPTISRSSEIVKRCPNINNIIYNPANISPFSVPIEGLGTSDQYAIGDLSGKYGTLLQKPNEKISTVDFNLPLFGSHSVVGRALVFYAPNGTTVACANLDLVDTEMTVAFATFDKPIQGQIILKQAVDNCTDNTYVYFEVSRSNQVATTINHRWSIHKNPIFTETSWSTSECSHTDEIFNPYNKSANARDCSAENPVACPLGDMSQKLRPIDIVPYKVTDSGDVLLKKYYFTDTFLPLCGPNSVIGKSIQVNEQNQSSEALSCTNIVLFESDDQDYS